MTPSPTERSGSQPQRVSVLVGSRSVPLLPGNPEQDSIRSPWTGIGAGIVLEKHTLAAVEIPVHEHPTFCLHLQTGGTVEMDWNSAGKTGHVHSATGDLILLAPGTRDSMLWHGTSQRIIASVEPSLLTHAAGQLGLSRLGDFENRWTLQDEQLRLLLTEMEREMASGWPMGALYGDLIGLSLSIALVRKYASPTPPPLLKGGLARAKLRHVLDYIETHLDRELRLEELATLAGLSLFHFARSFRESTGFTPHQYIVEKRVARAKLLLAKPEWTIEQVASAVGFQSASRFTSAFRANTGATPTFWRRNS
ncbi:AraC family transcriptional regulator [Granulicella sp. WH15]|uniref:AraC family transcriptional regulator n=1 Tax=Granulicella sp. WH15 TaxID=2602070 RepID=UPI0013A54EC6|nr:AraC family transcriptional regulator [Granulicella sp. WH15]